MICAPRTRGGAYQQQAGGQADSVPVRWPAQVVARPRNRCAAGVPHEDLRRPRAGYGSGDCVHQARRVLTQVDGPGGRHTRPRRRRVGRPGCGRRRGISVRGHHPHAHGAEGRRPEAEHPGELPPVEALVGLAARYVPPQRARHLRRRASPPPG